MAESSKYQNSYSYVTYNTDFPTFPGPRTLVCRLRGRLTASQADLSCQRMWNPAPCQLVSSTGLNAGYPESNCSQPLYKINQEIQRQTLGRGNVRSGKCSDGEMSVGDVSVGDVSVRGTV